MSHDLSEIISSVAWAPTAEGNMPYGMVLSDEDIGRIANIVLATHSAALAHPGQVREIAIKPLGAMPEDATPAMIKAALAIDWDNEDEKATAHNVWHAMFCAHLRERDISAPRQGGDTPEAVEKRADDLARRLWAYFNDGPVSALWFDNNKDLGGPAHIRSLCRSALALPLPVQESEPGWKLVPIDPTPDMVTDGRIVGWEFENCHHVSDYGDLFRKQWSRALAAAPLSPSTSIPEEKGTAKAEALEPCLVGRHGISKASLCKSIAKSIEEATFLHRDAANNYAQIAIGVIERHIPLTHGAVLEENNHQTVNRDVITSICAAVVLGEDEAGNPVNLAPDEARKAISAYLAAISPAPEGSTDA